MRRRNTRLLTAGALLGLAAILLLVDVGPTTAQMRRMPGVAFLDPDWRFSAHDRPVKVVLLAGSIGAHRDMPYGRLLHQWCENAEIQNLSRVGQGAPQLASRFRTEVLSNPNVPVGARQLEMWLLFGGGLNSVGMPHRTNRAIRTMFTAAHRRNFRVVGLTLTPWGTSDPDEPRWQGGRALHALRSTRAVVDNIMGRLDPAQSLGPFVRERSEPDAAWDPSERPDVAIDLYDSPLRDSTAAIGDVDDARRLLMRDSAYRRRLAQVPEGLREAQHSADAAELASAPRWFLRRQYRAFDHIHPNRAGHEVMARTMCPQLPESWGCRCP